jgi:hypothetical protein
MKRNEKGEVERRPNKLEENLGGRENTQDKGGRGEKGRTKGENVG